jgi:Rod binding domain-containing protein
MPIELIKGTSPSLPSTSQGPKKVDEEKLRKTCMDFESLFIHQVLKSMQQTIPKSGLLGEGPEKGIFDSLFGLEWSKTLAHQGGLGLGKMLYKQMLRSEEEKHPSSGELRKLHQQGEVLLNPKEEGER